MEVCKYAPECGGVVNDERKKVNAEYHKGSIPFKQLVEERFAILTDEMRKNN